MEDGEESKCVSEQKSEGEGSKEKGQGRSEDELGKSVKWRKV